MDALVSRFEDLRTKIETDYTIYMTILPFIRDVVNDYLIKDVSRIVHQYLEPHPDGKGIFELRVKENAILYDGWDLWHDVADLPRCDSYLATNLEFYNPQWVLEDMEEAYKE